MQLSLEKTQEQLAGASWHWLQQQRQQALQQFLQQKFPTATVDDWKYCASRFVPFDQLALAITGRPWHEAAAPRLYQENNAISLQVINGQIQNLKTLKAYPGLRIVSLVELLQRSPQQLEQYFPDFSLTNNGFASLNTALADQGWLIILEAGTHLSAPIYVDHYYSDQSDGSWPALQQRNLIYLGENSSATLFETHHSEKIEQRYWFNALTQTQLQNHAKLSHLRYLKHGTQSQVVQQHCLRQQRNSEYLSTVIADKAGLLRDQLQIHLAGEHSNTQVQGLVCADQRMLSDHFVEVRHTASHTRSAIDYRALASAQATANIHAKVHVCAGIAAVVAEQSSRNLLLAKTATINTRPQMLIDADDVRCQHGATVGQLDREQLFYLISRGLTVAEAEQMLLHAFAHDALRSIADLNLRKWCDEQLQQRLWQLTLQQ